MTTFKTAMVVLACLIAVGFVYYANLTVFSDETRIAELEREIKMYQTEMVSKDERAMKEKRKLEKLLQKASDALESAKASASCDQHVNKVTELTQQLKAAQDSKTVQEKPCEKQDASQVCKDYVNQVQDLKTKIVQLEKQKEPRNLVDDNAEEETVISPADYDRVKRHLDKAKLAASQANKSLEEIKKALEMEQSRNSQNESADGCPKHTKVGTSNADSTEFNRFMTIVSTSKILNIGQNAILSHSDTLVRRSRPIIGNTERLRIFIKKLLNKQCTTVACIGGSVTHATRNAEGEYIKAYHAEFVKYLNEQYPCDGGVHKLHVHGPGGTDAAYAIYNFNQLFRGTNGHVDFVTFEYAVNDASTVSLPGLNRAETIQLNNEVLIRKALSYRNKDGSAPAVMWLGTSFFVSNMMNRDMNTGNTATHVFTSGVHFPILSYYDIPTVSAAQVWFPMLAKDLGQLEDKSLSVSNVFQDHCHPSMNGHIYISQLLAYAIETEKAWLLEGNELTELEKDLTLQTPPKFPDPWWLSDEEMSVQVDAQSSEFNFQTDIPAPESLLFNTGWEIFADSKKKYGLIASQSGSHVAFKFELINFDPNSALTQNSGGGPDVYKNNKGSLASGSPSSAINKLSLGYLKTYQGISNLYVWVDDEPDGSKLCTKLVSGPGLCYEFGCNCAAMKEGPRSFFNSQLWLKAKKPACIDDGKALTKKELGRAPKFHSPTSLMPDDVQLQTIYPLQRVRTSVYAHFDVGFSPRAVAAAANGKPVYVHACSTRFGETSDPAVAGLEEKPAPVAGDGKFKLLLVGAINGNVKIEKVGEREIGRRLL